MPPCQRECSIHYARKLAASSNEVTLNSSQCWESTAGWMAFQTVISNASVMGRDSKGSPGLPAAKLMWNLKGSPLPAPPNSSLRHSKYQKAVNRSTFRGCWYKITSLFEGRPLGLHVRRSEALAACVLEAVPISTTRTCSYLGAFRLIVVFSGLVSCIGCVYRYTGYIWVTER